MEIFDFETMLDRSAIGSSKWQMRTDEMKKKGIVPFSVADMELPTAPAVVRGLEEAVRMGVYGYTYADEAYREAVAGWYKRRHNWEFDPDHIVCTPGIVTAIYAIVREFTKPGDGIIVQPPVYYPFYGAIRDGGRDIVENRLINENGAYTMNLEQLRELAAKPENTMMILCSPHNPVSRVWSASELRSVADICMQNNVLLVSDEIHSDLISPNHAPHSVLTTLDSSYRESVIVCTSTAKTFNLAGFVSANTIIENDEIHKRLSQHLLHEAINGMSFFGRMATIAAYSPENGCDAWVDALNVHISSNFALLSSFAAQYPAFRLTDLQGTYLAWLDMSGLGLAEKELDAFLNEKALLSIDPGHWFGSGGSGFARFNIAVPRHVLEEGLGRLGQALKGM